MPNFRSFIVSDFGDLSPDALELQEWLVSAYAKSVNAKDPDLMAAILLIN